MTKKLDDIKLLAQREDEDGFYDMLAGRMIGHVRAVLDCSPDGRFKHISTCPVCCGRLKHNNYYCDNGVETVVVRCRLCDAEFVITVQHEGDLLSGGVL
ncbi:MAG: hypothetical protein WC307_07215 [Candidatus Nanoarchaeia archaeon]|jgi:hypothetical protein